MFKLNKISSVLLFMLIAGSVQAAKLDNIGSKTTELKEDATVSGNIQNMTSGNTVINGNGFGIDGTNHKNNASSGAWIRSTNSLAGKGYNNQIINIGKFNTTPLLSGGDNTVAIIKLGSNNEIIRHNLVIENKGAHNFTSTGTFGGSFMYSTDNLAIENSVFQNNQNNSANTGGKGGAIYHGHNTADVRTDIADNGAKQHAGELTVKNSVFIDNSRNSAGASGTSTSAAEGGAIYSQQKNGIFTVSDSYFINNHAQANTASTSSYAQARGGAIFNSAGSLDIDGSYFGGNYAIGSKAYGGAIYADSYTPEIDNAYFEHTFDKTVFENNSATGTVSQAQGGALYLMNDTTIKDALFISNKTVLNPETVSTADITAGGGAISQTNNTTGVVSSNPNKKTEAALNISNTVFKDNSVHFKDSNTEITKSASAQGGAIRLANAETNIKNTLFEGNSVINENTKADVASSGGAIAAAPEVNDRRSVYNFENTTFNKNKVVSEGTAQGGAIAVLDATNVNRIKTVNIKNSVITNNTANSKGNITDTGAKGGAIYAGKFNFINIDNSIVDSNEVISNAADNTEYGGGAAYVTDRAILTAVDTSFTNNKTTGEGSAGGAIYNAIGGTLNIIASKKDAIFEGNKANTVSNAIHNEGTLNLNSETGKSIVFNDKITSTDKAVITINKEGTWDKEKWPYNNRIPNDAPHGENAGTIALNEDMSGYTGTVDIHGGTIALGKNGTFFDNAKSFSVSGVSNLNLANGVIQNHHFKNLNLNANLNTILDADLAQGKTDSFTADKVTAANDAKINIDKINVIVDANDEFAEINLKDAFSEEIQKLVALEDSAKEAVGKIFKYGVTYNEDTGILEFERTGSTGNGGDYNIFAPSVLGTSVALQAIAQAGVRETMNFGFEHSDSFTKLPAKERYAQLHSDEYAITEFNNQLYGYNDQLENKGYWMRPYTIFEEIDLKHGPKVDNISYGTLIGYDSIAKKSKKGWSNVLSTYLGYHGSSLDYSDVDIMTNGFVFGLTKSRYRKNFWTALSATGGFSLGSIDTSIGKDNISAATAGASLRSGYNMEFGGGKFIIQPMTSFSYYFANIFDYTNAAGVKIKSDPLNTLEIKPGLRLIGNTEHGWQPYASASMVWNLFNQSSVTADGIKLPDMYVDPYVEYGLGFQKNKGEHFTCFMQTMARMGGRKGISLSGGLRWALGRNKKDRL